MNSSKPHTAKPPLPNPHASKTSNFHAPQRNFARHPPRPRKAPGPLATIDFKPNIRSILHAAIGPVFIIGPNNFPFAFNAISGGDFASAIAAGNPIIAKGHPGHPATTRIFAEEAFAALGESGLPLSMVQLIYHMSPDTGLRLAGDPRLGAFAFTGSRSSGLKLKAAADTAGIPAYLEMSSINPTVILPGALRERLTKIADEYADSALAAAGQFCTNPGLVILLASPESDAFLSAVGDRFATRPVGAASLEGRRPGPCRGCSASGGCRRHGPHRRSGPSMCHRPTPAGT